MGDLPIPAEAIEAAAKALHLAHDPEQGVPWGECKEMDDGYHEDAEAALRAAFDALGTGVEKRAVQVKGGVPLHYYRLVSRWFPGEPDA